MTTTRHVTWLLLAVLLQSLAPLELASHDHAQAAPDSVCSTPCPDETPQGDPCPAGCPCLCCPGHARILPGTVASLTSFVREQQHVDAPDHPHVFDLVSRVYRPPRSA